jgi:Carboxypeptidase regulatory-like domain
VSKRSIAASLALFAIALVAALALFLTQRETRPQSEAAAPAPHIETASEHVPENAVATEPPARETISAAPAATPPDPTPSTDSNSATLIVHVVAKETGRPVKSVHVNLFPKAFEEGFTAASVERSKGTMHEGLRPDEAGEVDFIVKPGKDLRLSLFNETLEAGSTELDVASLMLGERREVRLEVPTQNDLTFHGRVVSSVARSPLAGANIQAVSANRSFVSSGSEPGHEEWSRTKLGEATSDSDGFFELTLAKWKSPHLRVEADGYALALVIPTTGHETLDTARTIELDPAASLRVRIIDASGAPIVGAWVELETPGYSFNRSEEQRLMWSFGSLPPERWKSQSAPDGRCEITKLPPGIPITLEIIQNGRVLKREADPLTLKSSEERELEFRIGSGCTLNGQMLDQDGHSVGMQEVWMQKFMFEEQTYFKPHSAKEVVAKATTDSRGLFVLKDVPAGKWRIGPAAVRNHWEPPKEDALAPFGQVVDVGDGPSQDVTLQVYRGLYIRGVVVDPKNNPVSKCFVNAGQDEDFLVLNTLSGKDGTFALGPLVPGTYVLMGEGGGHAPSEPIRAEAGQREVSIRLRAGGSLSGRVVDAQSGEGCKAELTITPQHPRTGAFGSGMITWTNPDGTFMHDGLEPDLYGIAALTADGRIGILPSVPAAPDAKPGDLVISVAPGGRLRLRYDGAKPEVMVGIKSRGVTVGFPQPVESGKALEKRVPQGTLVIELRFEGQAEPRTMSVEFAAGEEKEVVIHDEK